MTTMTVQLRSIADTDAAIGFAAGHTVVVDRPEGKAGGKGLGFNGGQLLALAIGGCFCNDLHYVAHEMGMVLREITVDVTIAFEGNPLIATSATMRVQVMPTDAGADTAALIRRAEQISTVSNSLARGIPVAVTSK